MFGHGDHHHSHHGLLGHQQQEPQQQHSSPAPQHGSSHHGHHHLLHHRNDHGHHRDTHVRHENFAHLPAHDHSKVGGHTVTVHRGAYGSHTADGKHHAPLPADAVARQMHSYHPEIQKRAAQVANELAPARITPSTLTGQKRAVLIETGQSGAVQQIQQLLRQRGFNSFLVLTGAQATRSAVLDALNKLVANVSPGASLFFYYKGSTGTTPDKGPVYDEPTGMDETIVLQDGVIIDDDLHDILVRPLPKGVRLTALTDCASSGSVLDLSFTTVIPSANASRDVGGAPGVPVTQDGRQVALAHAMACGKAFLGHDSKAALQELIQAGTAYFGSQQGQQGGAGGSLGSLLGAFLQSQGGQGGGGGGGAAPAAGGGGLGGLMGSFLGGSGSGGGSAGGLGGLLGSFMGAQQGSQQQPVSQPEQQFSAPPSTPAPAPTASSAPAGDDDWMTPADMKPSTSNSSVATSTPVAVPAPAPAPAAAAEEDDWMTPADMKGRALSRDVGVFQVRTTVSEVVHFYRSGDGFGAANSEGSLTHAFVTVLQRNQSPSFQQLLSEMQATMGGQVPVLATGYQQASMNETFAL